MTSYAEDGTARTTGGDLYFVHVMDRCAVGSNFYCEEDTTLSTNILDPPIIKQMTDNGDGTYDVTFAVSIDGAATIDIFVAY